MEPFLKWAGGKRWFVRRYGHLLKVESGRYIEPFFGGGAAFFSLKPARALLNDANVDLIGTYRGIRNRRLQVLAHLEEYAKLHSKEFFYRTRDDPPCGAAARAAWFIYLNRTCWNGLFRVNRRGQFNVPLGTKDWVLRDGEDFLSHARLLRGADLVAGDFEGVISEAKKGDFLFVDPPYTTKHNNNGFVKYNEQVFSWSDQERLSLSLEKASKRGVRFSLLNAAHGSIRELYDGFDVIELSRSQVISGEIKGRTAYSELLIRNFK